MAAGLALALGSALGTNVAFLFKQRGAKLAPPVRARYPLLSAVGCSAAPLPVHRCRFCRRALRRLGVSRGAERYFGFPMRGSFGPAAQGLLLGPWAS